MKKISAINVKINFDKKERKKNNKKQHLMLHQPSHYNSYAMFLSITLVNK